MFFNTVTSILTAFIGLALLSPVRASPLSRRDIVIPKIITPDANTVWTVGHVESVTWDTSNFPPDPQISNPTGRVVLGYEENNSLHLDLGEFLLSLVGVPNRGVIGIHLRSRALRHESLAVQGHQTFAQFFRFPKLISCFIDHPLASGFKLRDGSVQITVPDVQPRDDYIIVLFGNSGNTSPAFSITKITATSPSSSSTSSTVVAPSQTILQPSPSPNPPSPSPPSPPPASESSSAAVPSADPHSLIVSSSSATATSSTPTASPTSTNGATTPAKTSQARSVIENMKSLMALTTCMTVTVLLLV